MTIVEDVGVGLGVDEGGGGFGVDEGGGFGVDDGLFLVS